MRRKTYRISLFILICLLLGSCQKTENPEETSSVPGQTTDLVMNTEDGNGILSVKSEKNILFEEPEKGYERESSFYETRNGKIYLLRTEYESKTGGDFRLCVQVYDSKTGKVEKTKKTILKPDIPGHKDCRIVSVGLTPECELTLRMAEPKDGETNYFLAKVSFQGEVLETEEPFPDEEKFPWNADDKSKAFCLTDGRVVVSRWDETLRTNVLTWFGGADDGKILGKTQWGVNAFCCGEEGSLYCLVGGESLIRWDVDKGVQTELFKLHENGITPGKGYGLFRTDDGELLLCIMDEEKLRLYELTDKEIPRDEEIRLACLERPIGIDYIGAKAANFSREAGNIPIVLEKVKETYQEDYRNRIMAELAAGKGPEMMWLSREDLVLLTEKGVLCDLAEIIPEETRNAMLPCALEVGTVDGKQVGFTPQVEFYVALTSGEIWSGDSWTPDEFMNLVESREEWRFTQNYNGIFYSYLLNDIENSPFLDLEQGICHFDDEAFIHILEVCKKYGQKPAEWTNVTEEMEQVRKGAGIIVERSVLSPAHFAVMMNKCGEDLHAVGIPSEKGSGNFVQPYSGGYLAVNAKAEHKEEIGKYIAYLASYENQLGVSGFPIRTDVLQKNYYYVVDGVLHQSEEPSPEGVNNLKKMMAFIESCELRPSWPKAIREIMSGVLPGYFEGNESARDVADLIQRRVQLYLNENK